MTSDFLKDLIIKMNLDQYESNEKKLTLKEAEFVVTLGHAFEKGVILVVVFLLEIIKLI